MFFERIRPGWAAALVLAGSIHCGAASTGYRASPASPVSSAGDPTALQGEGAADVAGAELDATARADLDSGEPHASADAVADDALQAHAVPMSDWTSDDDAPEVPRQWLSAGRYFEDTLRGDWDTPSALMVVYNSTWKNALRRLLSIAHKDLPVYVLATPKDARSREFARWLRRVPFAGLVSIELDTPWIRDYGPLEVVRPRGISWLDLSYAPDDRPLDDAVPTLLAEVFEALHEREHVSLDGGGIISNGAGLCGITEASFRAIGVDVADAERVERFLETVGCRTLALLPELPRESTGHVDMVAQFLTQDKVAIAVPTPKSSAEVRSALARARSALELAADAYSGGFVGVSVRDAEDSEAVIQAFRDGVTTTGPRWTRSSRTRHSASAPRSFAHKTRPM